MLPPRLRELSSDSRRPAPPPLHAKQSVRRGQQTPYYAAQCEAKRMEVTLTSTEPRADLPLLWEPRADLHGV